MRIISHHPDKLNWNKTWTRAILIRVKKGVEDMQEKEEGWFMVFIANVVSSNPAQGRCD
jgi:hypothetical protein